MTVPPGAGTGWARAVGGKGRLIFLYSPDSSPSLDKRAGSIYVIGHQKEGNGDMTNEFAHRIRSEISLTDAEIAVLQEVGIRNEEELLSLVWYFPSLGS